MHPDTPTSDTVAYQLVYKVGVTNAVPAIRQMRKTEAENRGNPDILLMDISHYVDNDVLVFTVIEEWTSLQSLMAAGSRPDLQAHFQTMNALCCLPMAARILKGPAIEFPLPAFHAHAHDPADVHAAAGH